MAFRLSTGLRTGMLGTGGFTTFMNGGKIEIYTGTQPTSADYIETAGATKLCVVTKDSSAGEGLVFGTAAAGVVPKSADTWSGIVLATGVAGWFRFYGTAGTYGSSSSEVRFDGNIGVSGANLNLSHTNLAKDSTLTLTTFNVTLPAE